MLPTKFNWLGSSHSAKPFEAQKTFPGPKFIDKKLGCLNTLAPPARFQLSRPHVHVLGVWEESGEHGENPRRRSRNMQSAHGTERPRARNPICNLVSVQRRRYVKNLLKSINVSAVLSRSPPFFSLNIPSFLPVFLLELGGDMKRVRVLCVR